MKQKIIGFEQDDLGDWRAILHCKHQQHIRHNPPFVHRPWVLTRSWREKFIGYELECKLCEDEKGYE